MTAKARLYELINRLPENSSEPAERVLEILTADLAPEQEAEASRCRLPLSWQAPTPYPWGGDALHSLIRQEPGSVLPMVISVEDIGPVTYELLAGLLIPVFHNSRKTDLRGYVISVMKKGAERKRMLDELDKQWPDIRSRLVDVPGYIDRERGPDGQTLEAYIAWLWHRVLYPKRSMREAWRTLPKNVGFVPFEDFRKGTQIARDAIGLNWRRRVRQLRG